MKVLVIPDIHLKPWIFDQAEEILKAGKAERAVCLMDVPDDWGMELDIDRYRETGLTTEFVKWLNEHLLDADIDDVIAAVNDAPQDYLWNDESPLWLRSQYKDRDTFRKNTYTQVVGHTPVERIFERDGIISTDVFSTYRDGTQIGEPAMIVIDSVNGKYEKVRVSFN